MTSLKDLDKKNIWHPFTPLQGVDDPILITSAKGVYLHTDDGRKIIDAVSSWWVNIHGHAHPAIADALAKQANNLEHVIFAGFTHEPAIHLSEKLLSILPSNQKKIFFSDNGSTAVEVALKMSFQFWHNSGFAKKNVVAFEGAYHGDTFGSMSVGDRGLFTKPFDPYLFTTFFLDFPSSENENLIIDQFKKYIKEQNIGTFIFEPLVQGAAGMRMYSPELLDRLISIAKDENIVCIADEVFTGFGRTGKTFASDFLKNKPDIIAISKGLTGGSLPLGITSCSDKILAAFQTDSFTKTFFHGHSYTANPLSCAAANTSFDLLMNDDCQKSIQRISREQSDFKNKISAHKNALAARSRGTILAIELKSPEGTSYENNLRKTIYDFFLNREILLRPLGNVLYVVPPYVITTEELKLVHSAILEFMDGL